ncbi:redoxin domain-containing protein, partial [Acinetobacter sp. WU_MDCI_Axc73]|nr:redoxin domain-containing protein [Acinetobacter sp. WU_MDCI_Axc73]
MSLINTEIKPFQATAYQNGQFFDISEADLKGKWSVVFFYPADFTFVCPTELEDLADQYAEFQKLGVDIYSVSTDTHFTHKAWHDTSDAIGKIQYAMIGCQRQFKTDPFYLKNSKVKLTPLMIY